LELTTGLELESLYIYFCETLLYLSFAFTGGYILLLFVPAYAKPVLSYPVHFFHYAIAGIPIFSFFSIIRTTIILRDFAQDLSFLQVMLIVLKDYSYGNAWIWNLIICTVMYMFAVFQEHQKWSKWALAVTWLGSILAHGWASHPAGFSATWGFLSQSIHVAAVSVWLGTLIIVAWFTRGSLNWNAFTRWYTPLSIGSIALIIAAGFVMMYYIVEGYINSWGINYGEALLLKHLVFLPLLLLGFMNGFLTKLTNRGQNERKLIWWLRIETFIALSILMITAYMGVQEPPHEDEYEQPSPSSLYTLLHGEVQDLSLQWQWNVSYLIMIALGLIALSLLYPLYQKNKHGLFAAFVLLGISLLFFGLLLSVQ
jgi:putative copper export protein